MEQLTSAVVLHQEQQQRQQQHEQSATDSRRLSDEAFDSVRQAAVVMFKQRTKDLTRLAQVESQCQMIDAELREAQTCAAQLAAKQASLEALVEEEQQRTRQREGRLQELHSTLVQLDEEQQASGKLQRSAEAAITAATDFIRTFTNTDGRLFHLLTLASARTAGRSARDLQRLVSDVQHGLAAVEEQQRALTRLPSLLLTELEATATDLDAAAAAASGALLRELAAKVEWDQHGELAAVVQTLQSLLAWLANPDDTQSHAEEHPLWLPLPPRLDTEAVERAWLGATPHVEAESSERGVDDVGSGAVLDSEAVHQLLHERLLEPLQALVALGVELEAVCAQLQLQPPDDAESFASTVAAAQQSWIHVHEAWQLWREGALTASTAAQAAAAADAELVSARSRVLELQQRCRAQSQECESRVAEVAQLKEAEMSRHAVAWTSGMRTLQAQRDSLHSMVDTTAALTEESCALAAALRDGVEQHASELHERGIALSERQEQLTAVQQRVVAAKARAAALDAEAATAQQLFDVVCQQKDALSICVSMPGQRSADARAAHLGATPLEPSTAWPVAECAVRVAQALQNAAVPLTATHAAALERVAVVAARLAAGDDEDDGEVCEDDDDGASVVSWIADLVQGTVCADAAALVALRLPSEVLLNDDGTVDAEVLSQLPYLHALEPAEAEARASAEEHRGFMRDAAAEITLLQSELAAVEDEQPRLA
ncbi:hypothetical protein NESM_000504800 [Novymonas esmeraldas]|uniref:Uncharacterized protein n=1 Tax=Novymonas esmeraldas TaxID=1808958 RepID=A0AAW0EQL0_9TRYP